MAEALIATIARAFYDDDVVCLVDVLLRDKYLRDDDMSPRLNLPAKQLRRTLQFLEEEQLVKHELVDDLAMGGSQNTKFWYIDYNHAVHVIRLRVHLLQKKLQSAELRARSSSLYLCPGYKSQTCNGQYNEEDAQQIVDPETGLFLCRECVRTYANHPNPPDRREYTLKLLDNQKELKSAMDNLRRVKVQLSSKVDMNSPTPLRQGIFDLLQKVRSSSKGEPLTSNLPSENIAMGIGTKRIAGTGRTAGILLKKQQKIGIVPGDGGRGGGPGVADGGRRVRDRDDELTFLKNAIGQEIAFDLERGGGARANLLATRGRMRSKLVDAAAMKVGVDIGLVARVLMEEKERAKRKREEEKMGGGNKKKKQKQGGELHFLRDNLGAVSNNLSIDAETSKEERERRRLAYLEVDDDSTSDDEAEKRRQRQEAYYVSDETDELRNLPEDDRRLAFQAQYRAEMERQRKLRGAVASQMDEDLEDDIAWEDG